MGLRSLYNSLVCKLESYHFLEMASPHEESTVTEHIIINQSPSPLQLIWLNTEGEEKVYNVVMPLAQVSQSTYLTHTWLVKSSEGRALLRYTGPSATLTICSDGCSDVKVIKKQPEASST